MSEGTKATKKRSTMIPMGRKRRARGGGGSGGNTRGRITSKRARTTRIKQENTPKKLIFNLSKKLPPQVRRRSEHRNLFFSTGKQGKGCETESGTIPFVFTFSCIRYTKSSKEKLPNRCVSRRWFYKETQQVEEMYGVLRWWLERQRNVYRQRIDGNLVSSSRGVIGAIDGAV